MMEKKTPLYESHVALGAKMVEFGGFLMPVQYPTGILAEHMAVREKAGLFDVSHMGELVFHGEDALANIQRLITTDISKMLDGDMRYGMFCNDEGGVVDDLIVYRMAQDDYLIVVNAGNRDKDAAWVETHLSGHPGYHDAGNEFGQIAVQGPVSKEILLKLITFCFQLPHFILYISIFLFANSKASYHVSKCSSHSTYQCRCSAAAWNRGFRSQNFYKFCTCTC